MILCTATLIPHRDPVPEGKLRALADATAAAGFGGVTLWAEHVAWAGAGLIDHHAALGLSIPFVEVAMRWLGRDRDEIEEQEALVLGAAEQCRARSIIAATTEPGAAPLRLVADSLRHLCELASDRGLGVSFEFLPWSAVPTLAAAVELLDAVDHPGLGLVLDAWHWHHQPGGPSVGALGKIDPQQLHVVQLDDVPPGGVADPRADGLISRLPPGEGVIDLDALLMAVGELGAEPLIAAEVFSHRLAALGPYEMAARLAHATRATIDRAAGPAAPG